MIRNRFLKRIKNDGVKPYVLEGINSFFDKINIVHKVLAPYHSESNGMAERLKCSLRASYVHVNEDQGFNLKQYLNIVVSVYEK